MSAVDTSVLAQLEALGGREFVDEMLATALEGIAGRIAEIHAAAEVGDVEGVARSAHALKSTAGAVGAIRLLASATAIEADAAAGWVDPGSPRISGLNDEFRAMEIEVAANRP
jgi:HPt (histidine-containing phosphotransfer) domain-containing protein